MPIRFVHHLYTEDSEFRFTVKTTGVSETFTLPLLASGNYQFDVVWGDGSADNIQAHDAAAKTQFQSLLGFLMRCDHPPPGE